MPRPVTKASDFSEWYNEAIDQAGLVDKRYPVQGMNVWTPYGFQVMALMDGHMKNEMARTGHNQVQFPTLIPEDLFQREAEHIKGFAGNVFWVTHGGTTPLEIKLLMRPTSEAAMYDMFRLWIRSHADLPLKLFQIVSVFRYETKQTRAFIRVREIHFFEGHTAHSTYDESEAQVRQDLEVMGNLGRLFCMPFIIHRRPEWDKFPGAYYSLGVDTYFPAAGRALQVGTIHEYRDNFARAYGITYEDVEGKHQYVHQTTYGMSERIIGAVVGLHGDDKGIVLPPALAPTQVVIVPIPAKGLQEKVAAEAGRLVKEVGHHRVHLDQRELRPGAKFFEWERKGVPLRLEIGSRDIERGEVVAVRRDTGQKVALKRDAVAIGVADLLGRIQADLYSRAEAEILKQLKEVKDLGKVPQAKILRMAWCGRKECGMELEKALDMSLLGVPQGVEGARGKCVRCGLGAQVLVDAAKTY